MPAATSSSASSASAITGKDSKESSSGSSSSSSGDELWIHGGHNDTSESLSELLLLHTGSVFNETTLKEPQPVTRFVVLLFCCFVCLF